MLKICFSLFEIFTLFFKERVCSVESIVEEVSLGQLVGRNLARLSLGFGAGLAAAVALLSSIRLLIFLGLLFLYLDSTGLATLDNLSGLLVSLDAGLATSLASLFSDLAGGTLLSTLLLFRSGLLFSFSISLCLCLSSSLLLGGLSFSGLLLHGLDSLGFGGLLLLGLLSSCLGLSSGSALGRGGLRTDSLQALECSSLCFCITSGLQPLLLCNMLPSEYDGAHASLSGGCELLLIVPPVAAFSSKSIPALLFGESDVPACSCFRCSLPFLLDTGHVLHVGPPGEVDSASLLDPTGLHGFSIVSSASPHSDLKFSLSLGGNLLLAGGGDGCLSLSDKEGLLVLSSALANPPGEVLASNVPALLLGNTNDLSGTTYLCGVCSLCCNLLLASCQHFSSGSGSLEHDLPPASQHLTALDCCSSCLSLGNKGSLMSSASFSH